MARVKEFHSRNLEEGIETLVNEWLSKNEEIYVEDIKYSANNFGSHALVIFAIKVEEEQYKWER